MVNKAPKPAKAPKVNKRAGRGAQANDPFMANFPEGSLFARSQQFVKENDAKPFRDFAYMVFVILAFFIWRLYVAVQSQVSAAIGIWSFFVFGTVVVLNIWTYFLVLICAKRGGDIGIVKITDEDIHRFMYISGLFGAWAAIICKSQEYSIYILDIDRPIQSSSPRP
ncbi:hypothetical protein BC939DRAFT_71778 [Gamsiella multidivaricata]|uniref:uncharacterized protein n=1 Tax=Gamsiella multidivaricata TaxID=101098 RepID=UPI002220F8C4|nr:uncharacterized protein BC939DRAFT_71778 [Gamsiella multidivaricata]KAI7828245.1 hypothetical protein BC939DRAFT_71778 [Gamsiella multidivaricata]